MSKQRGRTSYNQRRWARVYRWRMTNGLEDCRNIGCTQLASEFAHLVPHADGGRPTLANFTLLCSPCNQRQGTQVWPWLLALADEKDNAAVLSMTYPGIDPPD